MGTRNAIRNSDKWKIAKRMSFYLKKKYNVRSVRVFGSLANDKIGLFSDIDIAVEGLKDKYFYKAYAQISELAGSTPVDLVDIKDCETKLRDSIVRTGVEI
jgi:predicted nucleotidyltransferase